MSSTMASNQRGWKRRPICRRESCMLKVITAEDGRNLTELLEGTYQAAGSGKDVTF